MLALTKSSPPSARREALYASFLRSGFWGLSLLLGFLQAWNTRDSINTDGVAYLDLGDMFFSGAPWKGINGYWSPLYAGLLGTANYLISPSLRWEYPLVHAVNFIVYVLSLACFDFLLLELIQSQKSKQTALNQLRLVAFPDSCWFLIGYPLFIWSSLYLIGLDIITPDLCAASCFYLASGLFLRILRVPELKTGWLLLGLILGIGYLAKAPMLPIGLLVLFLAYWEARKLKNGRKYFLLAFASFALVVGPFVFVLSRSLQRLSFGESARLNYAWYINGIPGKHWQGSSTGTSGTALHPTRKIRESPPVYEFGSPIEGTYPVWLNPTYWHEGLRLGLYFKRQLLFLTKHVTALFHMLFALHGVMVTSVFLLLYVSGRVWLPNLLQQASIWFPAVFGMGMFSLVHLETRFVAPFFVLLFLGIFSSVRLPESASSARLFSGVSIMFLAMFVLHVGPVNTVKNLSSMIQGLRNPAMAENLNYRVVAGLNRLGIRAGSKIASLEYSNPAHAAWARLARVRIVAEICPKIVINPAGGIFADGTEIRPTDTSPALDLPDLFWTQSEELQRQVIDDFKKAGADCIVARRIPVKAQSQGWQQIGDTYYFVYLLGDIQANQPRRVGLRRSPAV